MAKFIELTEKDVKIVINADHITGFSAHKDGTGFTTHKGENIFVDQSYEEVKKLLGVE